MSGEKVNSSRWEEVLRSQYGKLAIAMQNPSPVAGLLWQENLISDDVKNRVLFSNASPNERASILLNNIQALLSASKEPEKVMRTFCGALKHSQEPPIMEIASKMIIAANLLVDDGERSEAIGSKTIELSHTTSHHHRKPPWECQKKKVLFVSAAVPILLLSLLVQYLVKNKVENISHSLGMKMTSDRSAMEMYLCFLNETYKSRALPTYFKGLVVRHKPHKFIHLALVHKEKELREAREDDVILQLHGEVEHIKQTKTPLNVSNIGFIDQRIAKRILIEGAPGVGKTTLAWHLCHLWAKGEILQTFKAIIMIQIRDKRVRMATNLIELIVHPELHVKQAVVEEIKRTNGRGFLLIFEGYDELSEQQLFESGIFQSLLRGDVLCASSIMVTSRPMASGQLPENFRDHPDLQHIEVLGFEKGDIDQYIKESCAKKADVLQSFRSYLSNHPFIYSAMYNPFHCAIITELYILHWKKDSRAFAPKTLTELYTLFTISFIQWELSDHAEFSDLQGVEQFSHLPPKIYDELLTLGELAADGIEQRMYVFQNVAHLFLQGFLQKVGDIYSSDMQSSYSFLHLTVQEYFAAWYWSQKLSSSKLSDLLTRPDLFPIRIFVNQEWYYEKENRVESMTHWPVLLFISGLTKLNDLSMELFKPNIGKSGQWNMIQVHTSLCKLLFECQCPQLISTLLTNVRKRFEIGIFSDHRSDDMDAFVAGYCFAHSNPSCFWELAFGTEKQLNMFAMGMHYSAPVTGEGGIITHQTTFFATDVIFKLHPHTRKLKKLQFFLMHKNRADKEVLTAIPEYFPMVDSLLFGYDGSLDDHWPLITMIPKLKNLVELRMLFSENETAIDKLPLSYQLQQCPSLKRLLMVGYEFAATDLLPVLPLTTISSILNSGIIDYLLLKRLIVLEDATAILTNSLRSSTCSLHTLELQEVTFSSIEAFEMLVIGAIKSKCLRKIILVHNSMSLKEAKLLASELAVMSGTLEEVDLSGEEHIGIEGAQALLESLNHNNQVQLRLHPGIDPRPH